MTKRLLIITQKVDEQDQLLGFFISWLREFAKHFSQITVLCLEKGDYQLPAMVRVVSLGKDRGLPKYHQLWNFYALSWQLRDQYDTVFVHMNPIWMALGGPLWRMLGKRTMLWYTHKAVTFRLWLAEKFSSAVVTASRESFRLPSSKVVVVGHGIDTALFRPDPSLLPSGERLRLLSVGRIAPVKHYEVLVDAARMLENEHIDFSVTLVGEPALPKDVSYRTSLQKNIASQGLADRFHFVGKVPHGELPRYYCSHTLFVHMSKTGSLDKTVLEALACGMSVVSSNDSSRAFLPAEYVFDENDSAGLARAIRYAAEHPNNFRDYVVQHHDLSRLISRLATLL